MNLSGYSALTLIERIDFADDLALFRMKPAATVDFTPGQYATIGLMDDNTGRPLLRPYSLASAPSEDTLEFFIERVDEGKLTPRLWELDIGAEVWMRDKIVGRFVLDESCAFHVMAATVTGVAPYVSIVRDQIRALESGALDEPHRMLILHGASHSWELGTYVPELTTLAETHDWLDYVPTISRPWDEMDWDGETGRVEDVLRKHMDAWAPPAEETAAYTCGHPQMIDKAQGILQRAKVDEDSIHEEKYFVERVSA